MTEFKAGQRVIWHNRVGDETEREQELVGVVIRMTGEGVVIQVRHSDGSLLDHTVEPQALARAPQPWDTTAP